MDAAQLDDLEYSAYPSKSKARLKTSLDIDSLMKSQTVTFEVDTDAVNAELALDDDVDAEEMTSYTANFFSPRNRAALSKNKTMEALAKMDFVSMSFSEIQGQMTSIHLKGLVMKQVLQAGTGKKVTEHSKLVIHYVGICEGADEPHDSSALRRTPTVFDMRKCDIIPGLYAALLSMELEELSKFIVKSPVAFGKNGVLPRILPDSDILYIVEVLQIIDGEMLELPMFMSADERGKLPFEKIHAAVDLLRTVGNGYFEGQNYSSAIKKYRKGISMLEEYPLVEEELDDQRNQLLHTMYSNLAQCYLNLDNPAKACTACQLGLKLVKGKNRVKLLFRYAKAKLMLQDYESARKICDEALKFDSKNVNVKDLRMKAIAELKKQSAVADDMFRGILK